MERDWLLDLDLDFISPFPFSLGERDRERDLLRDFSYSSFDLLREREREPRSDLGLDLLFDLDFLPLERDRDRPLLRDLDLDKKSQIFFFSTLPEHTSTLQTKLFKKHSRTLTGSDFLRYFEIYCGCSYEFYFVTVF